jgi:hypothetical protein
MRSVICLVLFLTAVQSTSVASAQTNAADPSAGKPPIVLIDPPEKGFFSKSLSFQGILIKSHAVVSNEALYAAYDRIARETANLPMVVSNLASAGAELHIIGRNQVTTDLPEWQHDKHVCLDEYNGLTRDQRTRGMGGLITSCGEENVLNLPSDRYRGSDICMHEFAHNIEGSGIPRTLRARFDEQYQKSKDKGLWLGSYAGSNGSEYFAELTMWYFGSHGSYNGLQGERPDNGAEGLKKYDPEAFALLDDFYSGRIPVERVEPRARRGGGNGGTNAIPGGRQGSGTNTFMRRDSMQSRIMVANLGSYKVDETGIQTFYEHAGMSGPTDGGANGWVVTQTNSAGADHKFVIAYRATTNTARQGGDVITTPTAATNSVAAAGGTNAPAAQGNRGGRGGGRGGASASRGPVAELEFKGGVLSALTWRN